MNAMPRAAGHPPEAISPRGGTPPPSALRTQDGAQLVRLVRECLVSGIGRRAVLLRLSRLPAGWARPHHLRLARAALDPLIEADRARLFTLPNGDLTVVWRGDAAAALAAVTEAVTRLFAQSAVGIDPASLLVPAVLPEQAALILDAVEDGPPAAAPKPPEVALEPLDAAALAVLERGLAQADVARFARRKQIRALVDGRFVLRWEKRYLSVAELAGALAPEHAAEADPWLFRRLTRTLDRRMLSLLAAPGELRDAGPFSLNLNVGSILSPDFLRFDAMLPRRLRGHVVIDVLPADVMADPAAFVFARDFARARGYRLLLRGLTADLLPSFPCERMGMDLLQLRWSADVAAIGGTALGDGARIVLTRANTQAALAWAGERGVTLFQRARGKGARGD